jgi:hypothetical protein
MKKNGKTSCIILAIVILFPMSSALASGAAITDADWVAMNNDIVKYSTLVGKGATYALLYDTIGNIYAGGAYGVCQWNGVFWQQIGAGISGTVYSIALDKSGNLYAGGDISKFANIAKWDGKTWTPLGIGTLKTIRAVAVDSTGNVYAGGLFDSIGGIRSKYVASWNGSAWLGLDSGISNSTASLNSGVYALVVDKFGNLYAGGDFQFNKSTHTMQSSCIAKWDGIKWSPLLEDNSVSGVIGKAYALTLDSKGNLYSGGSLMTDNSSTMGYNMLLWNGSTWSGCAGGANIYVYALAADTLGNVYVGGEFYSVGGNTSAINMAKYTTQNGWSTLGSGVTNTVIVNAIAADKKGHVCVGGRKQTGIAAFSDYVVELKNGQMVDVSKYAPYISAIAANSLNTIYVGGSFSSIGNISSNNLAKWNGKNWEISGLNTDGSIKCMTFDNPGNLFVGGGFRKAGGLLVNGIAKWSGNLWTSLGSGINGGINSIAFDSSGNLYAGGTFDTAGGIPAKNIAKWDGQNWSALGSGVGGRFGWVNSLACDTIGNLYVGGFFDSTGGVASNSIAKWDGNRWSTLGAGLNLASNIIGTPTVLAIAMDRNGYLFAGGDFGIAGNVPAINIAKWDGQSWSALGAGLRNRWVRTLEFDSTGNLYAGGNFDTADNVLAKKIAKWDGNRWENLGSGLNGGISAIKVLKSAMYVGGGFDSAGGKYSLCIAGVDIRGLAGIKTHSCSFSRSPTIRYHLRNSTLFLSNISSSDRISLYNISGCCIREAQGVSRIRLSNISPQPLIVRVSREGKIVSTGMVMAQ